MVKLLRPRLLHAPTLKPAACYKNIVVITVAKNPLPFLQVQKASGAYMLSARKQGLGFSASKPPGASTEPPSPLPFPDFNHMTNGSDVAASEDAESSLAEDEEFATEEHAHR